MKDAARNSDDAVLVLCCGVASAVEMPLKVAFEGKVSEHKWPLKELDAQLPSDWSDYQFLVLELKTSTPQRFSLWLHTADGKRRLMLQPFGQNVWLRASIPLQYFKGKDQRGIGPGLDQQPPHELVLDGGLGPVRGTEERRGSRRGHGISAE